MFGLEKYSYESGKWAAVHGIMTRFCVISSFLFTTDVLDEEHTFAWLMRSHVSREIEQYEYRSGVLLIFQRLIAIFFNNTRCSGHCRKRSIQRGISFSYFILSYSFSLVTLKIKCFAEQYHSTPHEYLLSSYWASMAMFRHLALVLHSKIFPDDTYPVMLRDQMFQFIFSSF